MYTAALLNACGRRSDFRDVAFNLPLKLVTSSNLRPHYTMHCFTCVLYVSSHFHWRFGYQHVGIQNTSENAKKNTRKT